MNNTQVNIKNFLPHRSPMLMVDDLISIDNETVETTFKIRKDCVFTNNNTGFFCEAGLIENAAQTCSAIVGQNFFDKDDTEGINKQVLGFISGIKTLKINSLPSINDIIATKSNLISKFDAGSYIICTMDCKTYIHDNIIANFTMNLFIQEV